VRSAEQHAAYLEAYDVAQTAKAEGRIEEAVATMRQYFKTDATARAVVERMPADGGVPQWAGGPNAKAGPPVPHDNEVYPPVTEGEMLARSEVRRQQTLARITEQELAVREMRALDEDMIDRAAVNAAQREVERARRRAQSREQLAAKIRRGVDRIAWLTERIGETIAREMRLEYHALVRRQQARLAQYQQQFGDLP